MKITNEKLLQVITAYSKENEVEVFKDLEFGDNGLELDVDQGFIEHFEATYPGINLDEKLEQFFSALIETYIKDADNKI